MLPAITDTLSELLILIARQLQLPASKHDLAVQRYKTITEFLERHPVVGQWAPHMYPQGSMRIRTVVRPLGREDFDLDFILLLNLEASANPLEVLNQVEACFRESDRYKDMVERNDRCVTIEYADDFKMDIVPAIRNEVRGKHAVLIPDRKLQKWIPTNPEGLALWFDGRAAAEPITKRIAASADPVPEQVTPEAEQALRIVVQLLKRMRDIDYQSESIKAPPSILLSVLAAGPTLGGRNPGVALTKLIGELVTSLSGLAQAPEVENPANEGENLARQWREQPASFTRVLQWLGRMKVVLEELSTPRDMASAQAILEKVFGVTPTRAAVKAHAAAINERSETARLAIDRKTTGLSVVTSPDTVPSPRHKFYGG